MHIAMLQYSAYYGVCTREMYVQSARAPPAAGRRRCTCRTADPMLARSSERTREETADPNGKARRQHPDSTASVSVGKQHLDSTASMSFGKPDKEIAMKPDGRKDRGVGRLQLVANHLQVALEMSARVLSESLMVDPVPQMEDAASTGVHKRIAVLGVPQSDGQPLGGCEYGAAILRDRGLVQQLMDHGHLVTDEGDIHRAEMSSSGPVSYNSAGRVIKNAWSVGQMAREVFERSLAMRMNGQLPVVLGGDHSIACGSVSAALATDPNVGVLWVDAHADINTPESSLSMNMHGMPLSFLMDLVDATTVPGFEWMANVPVLQPHRIVYVGLRDIDDAELVILRSLGITTFTMHDVKTLGIQSIMQQAMRQLVGTTAPSTLHVSWDIDAVDPAWAPSTGTSVTGGLSMSEAGYIADIVAATHALASVDMVEVNPMLGGGVDDANRTADFANTLISSMLRPWNTSSALPKSLGTFQPVNHAKAALV